MLTAPGFVFLVPIVRRSPRGRTGHMIGARRCAASKRPAAISDDYFCFAPANVSAAELMQ